MEECDHSCANKSECFHTCCKTRVVDIATAHNHIEKNNHCQEIEVLENPPTLDELKLRGTEALEREDLNTALDIFGRALHLYVHSDSECFFSIVSKVHYSDDERQILQQRVDRGEVEAVFLLAALLRYGAGPSDEEAAFALFSRAASLGHIYARAMVGCCFENGSGVEQDQNEARHHYLEAANAGCKGACYGLAKLLQRNLDRPEDLHLAAVYYQRAGYFREVERLKRRFPVEVSPWSRWSAEAKLHSLVPHKVHCAMRTWALLAKRTPLPRDLHNIVAAHICTQSGW